MKEKKNKKTWLIIVCVFVGVFILLGIIGSLDEEYSDTGLENDLGLKVGCYYTDKNPSKQKSDVLYGKELYCFKENSDFYIVTRANNKYYNDTDMTTHYEFEKEDGSFSLKLNGENFSTCSISSNDSFKCSYSEEEDQSFSYIDIEELGNLEEYPTEEPIQLIYEDNPVDITYRPLDPVFTIVKEHLDSDHKITNWSANNWAITPVNMNSVLKYTGLDYNTYIENFCLYEIKVDDIIVENYNTFIPFGAKTITVTKK